MSRADPIFAGLFLKKIEGEKRILKSFVEVNI